MEKILIWFEKKNLQRKNCSAVADVLCNVAGDGLQYGYDQYISTVWIWCSSGFKDALNWVPLIPRITSFSDGCTVCICFHFFSHWMGYNRGDSFSFDSESNEIPFGSESKRKLSPRSFPIQCKGKWKYSFLSVGWGWLSQGSDCT